MSNAVDNIDLIKTQQNEITEYEIYRALSQIEKDPQKSGVLAKIADEEHSHYKILSGITGKVVQPDIKKVRFYLLLSKIFGYHFALKHMENGEKSAQRLYETLAETDRRFEKLINDEEKHEKELIELINEERLEYISSMILGLNDGVVELLGTVAGLSFALSSTRAVGLTSLIMGIAACLSMSSSEYLSTRSEEGKNPLVAAFYTGFAYLVAVISIIFPYFILSSTMKALFLSIAVVLLLIGFFNYYVSVVKGEKFFSRWLEMALIVLIVGSITFSVGIIIRKVFGVEV